MIDFWATWAGAGNEDQMPALVKDESLDKNIRIIRLAVDSDLFSVKKYISDNGMEKVENYNVADATKCSVVDELGGENGMIPHAIIVDT